MRLVDHENPITRAELKQMSAAMFGDLVKAVLDVRRDIMAVDAELPSDEEAFLVEQGSAQEDLWGINLYPDLQGREMVEFDSFINLRPSRGNRSRDVEDATIRERILRIVEKVMGP
jgi:hypothetical protein